ncbi:MAG TPA: ATP-dependent DNA helicase RecG, partial [Candidatus Berkiella sp.]|nr:ATP-dependent DNA helicase RecG [Candidatus Berkiella sp.]
GSLSKMAKERLSILRDNIDGFIIAEADLAMRGPGEILGTKQTGAISFKIADLQRDQTVLESITEQAQKLQLLPAHYIDRLITKWLGFHDYTKA